MWNLFNIEYRNIIWIACNASLSATLPLDGRIPYYFQVTALPSFLFYVIDLQNFRHLVQLLLIFGVSDVLYDISLFGEKVPLFKCSITTR